MAHQTMQEGGLWPNVIIELGPHWRTVKLTRANIVAVLDVGS